jgi:hypothetical protein
MQTGVDYRICCDEGTYLRKSGSMYFIDFVNFENAGPEVNGTIQKQLQVSANTQVCWARWLKMFEPVVPIPDVSLIYAPRLNMNRINALIHQVSGRHKVLYGCVAAVTPVPLLLDLSRLDDLLALVPLRRVDRHFITREPPPTELRSGTMWKSTFPMELNPPKKNSAKESTTMEQPLLDDSEISWGRGSGVA